MEQGYIWINGASSGIGAAIAEKFANEGSALILTARRIDKLNLIKDRGGRDKVKVYSLDISDLDAVKKFPLGELSEMRLNCIINNAGVTTFTPAESDSIEVIQSIINTNLTGAIASIKQALPLLKENRGGIIINILSAAARKVFTNSSVYAASKAGLAMYSKVLREEVRKYDIKVINIYPGATATPIWPQGVLEKHSERMMTPSDLADLIFQLYNMKGSVVAEEVELRPIKGDL